MELLEVNGSDVSSDLGSNSRARISDEVLDIKQLNERLLVFRVELELPVVGQLQGQSGVVAGLHLEYVREEVRAQANEEGLDDARALGLASREVDHCELLVRLQLNQVGAVDNAGLLALVVVDLHG